MKNTIKQSRRILLAEDDQEMRRMLARILRQVGYDVEECADGMILLDHLGAGLFLNDAHEIYDLVISDICMPKVTGMEVLEDLYMLQNLPPVILITAFGDERAHLKAELYCVAAMFDKPFDIDELVDKVKEIIP